MKYLPIPTFTTVDRETNPRLLPDTSLSDGQNVIFRNRKVKTRWGYLQKGTTQPLDGRVLGLIEYKKLRADEKTQIAVTGERVYELNATTDVWGEISPAYTTGTVSLFGTEVEYSSNTTQWPHIAKLSSAKIAIAFWDDTDGDKGKCIIGTVANSEITFGSEVIFDAGDVECIGIAALDASKIAIAYRDNSDANKGKCIVATVAGTVPTFGAEVAFEAGATRNISICALDASKIAIAYCDDDDSDYGKCIVATVAGTVPTFGAAVNFNAGTTGDPSTIQRGISIDALSSAAIVIAYWDISASKNNCIIATVSGTTPTFGSEVEIYNATTGCIDICAMSSTKIAVVHNNDYCSIATVSGTTPTFGTPVDFGSGGCTITALSDSKIAIVKGGGTISIVIGSVSGTVPTFGNSGGSPADGNWGDIVALSETAFAQTADSDDSCVVYDQELVIGSGTTWGTTWPASTYLIKFSTTDLEGTGTPDVWFTITGITSTTLLAIDNDTNLEIIATGSTYVIHKIFISTDSDYYDTCNIIEGLGGSDEKQVILTNGVDPIWLYQGTGYCDALDMTGDGGAAPIVTAKYCAYYHDHVIFGWCNDGTNDLPQTLYWNFRGYPTYWSTGSASYADLTQGDDWITGMEVYKERLYIFKEDSIVECYYTGLTDPALEFTQDKVTKIGSPYPRSIIGLGEYGIVFRSRTNIYIFNGFQPIPIGDQVIRDILDRERTEYASNTLAKHLNKEFIYGLGIVDKYDTNTYDGTITDFSANIANDISAVGMTSALIAVAYRDETDGNKGKVVRATVSGTTPTFAATATFETGATSYINIIKMDTVTVAIVFRDEDDGNKGKCRMGNAGGLGTTVDFASGSTAYINATSLSSSLLAIAYSDADASGAGKCILATTSVITPTFGSAVTFETGNTDYISMTALSATEVAIAYVDIDDGNKGKCVMATIVGTVPTFGEPTTFSENETAYVSIDTVSRTKFVIAYSDVTDSDKGKCIIGRRSGVNMKFDNTVEFEDGETININIKTLSNYKCVISYVDVDDSNKGKYVVALVYDAIMFFDNVVTFESGSTGYTSSFEIDDYTFGVAYSDADDSDIGKCVLSTASTLPSKWYWYNYKENSWAPERFKHRMSAFCINDDNEVILGDEDGYVYVMDYTNYDDDGTDIESFIVTKDFALNDYKYVFKLLETILTTETNEGELEISCSLDFGDTYSAVSTINQDTIDSIYEHVVNWLQKGEQVRFKISNVSGSKIALESLLIGFVDAGISVRR